METKILNPFSLMLKKQPFQTMHSEPIYKDGDFVVYNPFDKYFVHCYKNIVITERCALNKSIITNVKNQTPPSDSVERFHCYDRCIEALNLGLEWSKNNGFEVK